MKKELRCPQCNSDKVAVIFYGYPANMKEALQNIQNGVVISGGCCISDNNPAWYCHNCKNRW